MARLEFFTTTISLQQKTDQICIHHLYLNIRESHPSPRLEATRFATNIDENSTTLNFQRAVRYCNLVQPAYVIVSLHSLQDRKILNM
jgi:hypothetical protein